MTSTTLNFSPQYRPQKVSWVFPLDDRPLVEKIRSKSGRKFLKNIDEFMKSRNLHTTFSICTKAEYLEWLSVYTKRSEEQNHQIMATPAWYDQKLQEKKRVETMKLLQGDKVIGQKIISVDDNNAVRGAFKVSYPLDIDEHNISTGFIMDYFYLDYYLTKKPSLLTVGSSRNIFNIDNSHGYLNFKLRMGFEPEIIVPDTKFDQELHPPEEKGILFFLTTDTIVGNLSPQLYVYNPKLLKSDALTETKKLISTKEWPHDSYIP